ncbi:hypothetical protein TorRG33x02_088600 [Trema orientale]|uniref:Uncharacterized protein n=1 Tax=Trema orientale TaxID=63057 RepID=A0A2P5FC27_TREOI|nr:hypothetical protein TorRG33x02_088600 [Trema orientale]
MAADQAGSGEHVITIDDVNGLATELKKSIADDSLFRPLKCCIFRVPTILSRHNENAYVPNAFSIGPFHYMKQPVMQATQKIKLRYLKGLISRSQPSPGIDDESRLKDFINAVGRHLEVALEYYAEPVSMSLKEFTHVLVVDGCFLIELFRKKAYKDLRDENDPIFKTSCLLQFLHNDLILLENQIPWLVLDTLFQLTKDTSIDKKTLVQLAIEFFGNIFSTTQPPVQPHDLDKLKGTKHILDLLRSSLVCFSNMYNAKIPWKPMPSASRLKEAGVKFKKAKDSKSILDIKFSNGVLEIPPLLIEETTEPIFRNLICLEQCCPGYEAAITSYAILMDNLINTTTDMDILCDSGVVQNWLNVEDATKFFNQLYTDTYVKENYYLLLAAQVNRHCKRHWPRYRTVLMRDYFNHPWALTSVIVAAFLVVCTFLQTYYSIVK